MSGVTYGPDQPLRIIALERTCQAHPSQWEGESEHHASVLIHYRFWRLGVRVGPDLDAATASREVWEWDGRGGRPDGTMTFAQLRATLPSWITIPDGTEAERQERDGGYVDLPEISAAGQAGLDAWYREREARTLAPRDTERPERQH